MTVIGARKMNNVPFHHWPSAAVAVRMGRVLAAAGLSHPVSELAADNDIMDWSVEFSRQHGALIAPIAMKESDYEIALKDFIYKKARFNGWLPPEARDQSSDGAADFVFNQNLQAARAVQAIPGYLPVSSANQVLLDEVSKELQHRALELLSRGEGLKAVLYSVHRDGRFHILSAAGIRIASAIPSKGDKPSTGDWITALRSNLGLIPNTQLTHQVVVEVGGRQSPATDKEVRISVLNERMSEDEGVALLSVFTHEGVVTDLTQGGEVIGSKAEMYDDICAALDAQERLDQPQGN